MEPIKSVSHRYCFMTGRHGEFLYLKLGATWFCFGLLVNSALILTYQGVFGKIRNIFTIQYRFCDKSQLFQLLLVAKMHWGLWSRYYTPFILYSYCSSFSNILILWLMSIEELLDCFWCMPLELRWLFGFTRSLERQQTLLQWKIRKKKPFIMVRLLMCFRIKSEFTMRQPSDVPFLSHSLHNLNFRRMFMGIFFVKFF